MRPGRHRSVRRGLGAEFQLHRPYRAGDDLKHVDWKLLARTDRLYARQYRDTTSLPVVIVLDASASMRFPDPDAGDAPVHKLRYGAILAASLAWLAIDGGDQAGLLVGRGTAPARQGRVRQEKGVRALPVRGSRMHLRRIIAELEGVEGVVDVDAPDARRADGPPGAWDAATGIDQAVALLGRRGLLILISDLLDADEVEEEATRAALRRAVRRGHDVVVLQLTSEVERTFPWSGVTAFEDPETGARRIVDTASTAEAYRTAIETFFRGWREGAARDGIDHDLVSIEEAPSEVLRRMLLRRASNR